jgi:hypothetical protein
VNHNLELAAENIMIYNPNCNVTFISNGLLIGGRVRHGAKNTINIVLSPPSEKYWPESGVTNFGWWLAKQWIEKIPHWKNLPFSIELMWLARRPICDCMGNPFDHFSISKPAVFVIKKWWKT